MSFKVGDQVYIDNWGRGIIVSVHHEDMEALVEMETGKFGGAWPFTFEEMELIKDYKATLKAFKSVHGTVHVVVQNCPPEVITLLHRLDVWKSNGNYKYDTNKPKERPEIWFECPMEFLDFVESSMGRAAFERMGVEEFDIQGR